VEGIDVLPLGGGYTWPLIKDTLLILVAERLVVAIGATPVLLSPPFTKSVDKYRVEGKAGVKGGG
jgi:hypothetical protein